MDLSFNVSPSFVNRIILKNNQYEKLHLKFLAADIALDFTIFAVTNITSLSYDKLHMVSERSSRSVQNPNKTFLLKCNVISSGAYGE